MDLLVHAVELADGKGVAIAYMCSEAEEGRLERRDPSRSGRPGLWHLAGVDDP